MNARSLVCAMLTSALLFAACTKETVTSTPNAPAGGAAHTDGAHGAEQQLGSLTIGAHTFDVVQAGAVAAGKEAYFDLVFPAGKPVPSTVRAWLGVESGEGSMKSKLGKEGDRALHGHVEADHAVLVGMLLGWQRGGKGQQPRG